MTYIAQLTESQVTQGKEDGQLELEVKYEVVSVDEEELPDVDWQAILAGTCAGIILTAAGYAVYKKYQRHAAQLSDAYHSSGQSLQKRQRHFLDLVQKETDKIRVADSSKVENEERPS